MRVCIFGAGAVGSHLAARLVRTEAEISVVARGRQLDAIQSHGITLTSNDENFNVRVEATDDPATLPPQDIIFTTMKATALPDAADSLSHLCRENGTIAFAVNGVPWWWHYGLEGNRPLPNLDHDSKLWNLLRHNAIGASIASANTLIGPGHVKHVGLNNWTLGEPTGALTERLRKVTTVLQTAGVNAVETADIRTIVWRKLVINATFNPLEALTCLYGSQLLADERLRNLAGLMMTETLEIGKSLGLRIDDMSPEEVLSRAANAPARPSSMLQDVLARRRVEVNAILGQLIEFGEQNRVEVRTLSTVYALLRGRDAALAAG